MIFKCKSCEEFQCSEQCHCEMVHGKPKGCIKGEHGGTMEWVTRTQEESDTSWIKSGIWCYDHNELEYAYIAVLRTVWRSCCI